MKPKYYRLTRIREKSKEVGGCKYFVILVNVQTANHLVY